MKNILLNFISNLSFKKRRRVITFINNFRTIGRSGDLDLLASVFKTDKFGTHNYTKHYRNHFADIRNKSIKLLEIGVGGYENPLQGAGSLRMWKRYFSKGEIFAIDIYDKSQLQESRIHIFQGSQCDIEFLESTLSKIGELDIIIDDGSHLNSHVITSFEYLFPKLKKGGIYVVEDTQTSYWSDYGGNVEDFNSKKTMMGYFKSLIDGLNHEEFRIDSYKPNFFEENIESIHFYHNLIFIYKY